MGYHGIVFLPEDIEVLTQDAQALKVFCAAQYEKQPSGQFLFAGVRRWAVKSMLCSRHVCRSERRKRNSVGNCAGASCFS